MNIEKYKQIEGWGQFRGIFKEQINKISTTGHFVEIGTYHGKSAALMGMLIRNSGKDITFDTIDMFEPGGDPTTDIQQDTEQIARANLSTLQDYVNIIKNDSISASEQYDDNSLDYVFIDACHKYSHVKADLNAWYPKVKPNGFIAGHDIDRPGVEAAVTEFSRDNNLPVKIYKAIICWSCKKAANK